MSDLNWSDFRYVLAIARSGSLAAAARRLEVNETTVARRLRFLEQAASARLFLRAERGRLYPTDEGQVVLRHAERIEREAERLADALGHARGRLAGQVRVTAVPVLVNHVLVPAIGELLTDHPDLEVELVPETRDLNLTRREADLAVRLARPNAGGQDVLARRIGHLDYELCCAEDCVAPEGLPWLHYDAAHGGMPQARWVARQPGQVSGLKVADAEILVEAIAAGIGKGLLPACIASKDPRLRSLDAHGLPIREVWLLSHKAQRGLAATEAVSAWLRTLAWS